MFKGSLFYDDNILCAFAFKRYDFYVTYAYFEYDVGSNPKVQNNLKKIYVCRGQSARPLSLLILCLQFGYIKRNTFSLCSFFLLISLTVSFNGFFVFFLKYINVNCF